MNERERLIELIMDAPFGKRAFGERWSEEMAETIADHLISHGETIPAQGRLVKHNYLGHEQWTCSECQTLVSPQWKCCPVCEARMPETPKEEE